MPTLTLAVHLAVHLALTLTLATPPRPFRIPPPPAPIPEGIDATRYPDADAVVILDDTRILFDRNPEHGFYLTRAVRLRVLTPQGRLRSDIAIPLDRSTTLIEFHARSHLPFTTPKPHISVLSFTVGIEEITRHLAMPQPGAVFADRQIASAVVPAVDVSRVVEYRYTLHIRRPYAIPDHHFHTDMPVIESRLRVEDRDGLPLAWSFTRDGHVEPFEPEKLVDTEGLWLTWSLRDLPALAPAPDAPHRDERVARLRIVRRDSSHEGTLDAVAARYRALRREQGTLPTKDRAAFARDTATLTPRQKAERAYALARDRLIHIAAHEGRSPYQPRPSSVVLRHGGGDSSDFVGLLIAIGDALGLTFQPVLVATAHHGPYDPALPALNAFDHVIAALELDGAWHYLDPTAPTAPFGALGPHLQGRPALRIGPDTATPLTLPVEAPETNRLDLDWHLTADRLTLDARATGHLAATLRADPDGPALAARRALLAAIAPAAITTLELTAPQPPDTHDLHLRATLDPAALWHPLGDGEEALPLAALIPRHPLAPPPDRPHAPATAPPQRHTIHLDLPAGVRLPPGLTARAEGDRLHVEITFDADTLDPAAHRALDARRAELRRALITRTTGAPR